MVSPPLPWSQDRSVRHRWLARHPSASTSPSRPAAGGRAAPGSWSFPAEGSRSREVVIAMTPLSGPGSWREAIVQWPVRGTALSPCYRHAVLTPACSWRGLSGAPRALVDHRSHNRRMAWARRSRVHFGRFVDRRFHCPGSKRPLEGRNDSPCGAGVTPASMAGPNYLSGCAAGRIRHASCWTSLNGSSWGCRDASIRCMARCRGLPALLAAVRNGSRAGEAIRENSLPARRHFFAAIPRAATAAYLGS